MQAVVNSLITNYQTTGDGPTIVLLHGWGDNLGTFSKLQKDLSHTFTVISLDLPGFGASEPPLTTWDLDDYANHVADFLVKIEAGPLYAIIGHSNGGAIAIRGLATKRLAAEKLVLLAASGIRIGGKLKRAAFKATAKVGKYAALTLPAKTRRKLRNKLYQSVKSEMLAAEHLEESFRKVVGQDIQSDARKIKIPTLLIYGQGDTDTPALFGIRFNKLIKKSQLMVLDSAGHFVHKDEPEAVDRAISQFLKRDS